MIKDKLFGILKKEIPNHVAIVTLGFAVWARKNKIEYHQAFKKKLDNIKKAIDIQIENKIPIMTIHVTTSTVDSYSKQLEEFLESIRSKQVKVIVLGKWYGLSVVESIKNVMRYTKDNKLLLNLCIGYDGQEEIVDACKLISKKIKEGKLDINEIDRTTIKENLYTSHLPPPNMIITSNGKKKDILLWSSGTAKVISLDKPWPEVSKNDLVKALFN